MVLSKAGIFLQIVIKDVFKDISDAIMRHIENNNERETIYKMMEETKEELDFYKYSDDREDQYFFLFRFCQKVSIYQTMFRWPPEKFRFWPDSLSEFDFFFLAPMVYNTTFNWNLR